MQVELLSCYLVGGNLAGLHSDVIVSCYFVCLFAVDCWIRVNIFVKVQVK